MNVPINDFKAEIANAFFDKSFDIYEVIQTIDARGWSKISDSEVVSDTFVGNISFDNSEEVQKEFGIQEEIDATISTHENVEGNIIIGYLGTKYYVLKSLPRDTHYLLAVKKWLSKSSTLISA